MEAYDDHIEFYEVLDTVLKKRIRQWRAMDASILMMGAHKADMAIVTLLSLIFGRYKNEYNDWRRGGMSLEEAEIAIASKMDDYLAHPNESVELLTTFDITQHSWYDALISYREHLLVYLFDEQQLRYLTPLITALDQPVVLLSEYDLPDDTDLPEYVTAITLEFSEMRWCANSFLESNFPLIFHYFNTLDILVRILSPKEIFILEGYHYPEKILTVVGHSYGVPTKGGWL